MVSDTDTVDTILRHGSGILGTVGPIIMYFRSMLMKVNRERIKTNRRIQAIMVKLEIPEPKENGE